MTEPNSNNFDRPSQHETTMESMVQQILAALLKSTSPGPGADKYAALMMPLLRKLTNNDVLWDAVVHTDATAEGIYQESLRRRRDRLEAIVQNDFNTQMTRDAMRNWEMTKVSETDWTKQRQKEGIAVQPGDYDRYIQRQVDGAMANKFWMFAFGKANQWLNLDGSGESAANLGMMMSNFANTGMYRNDRNAFMYSRFMAEDLFNVAQSRYDAETGEWLGYEAEELGRDAEGDIVPGRIKTTYRAFDKTDWAGFSKQSVTGLAANLSKDMDILRGINPDEPYELSLASERFKDTLHRYLEALRPMRDAFGNDMPKIIQVLEHMGQTSMMQMGPQRAAVLAQQITDRIAAGRYSMSALDAVASRMNDRLGAQEGLGSRNYLNAPNVAMFGLDMAAGGSARPDFMTDRKWLALSTETAYQISNGEAEDQFALAYSVWAQRKELEAPVNERDQVDNSFETFQNLVKELADSEGMDMRMAARRIAGAETYNELRSGLSYGYYRMAKDSGDAARMSLLGYVDQQTEIAAQIAATDESLQRAINAVVVGAVPTNEQAMKDFAGMLKANPSLLLAPEQEAVQDLMNAGISDANGGRITSYDTLKKMLNTAKSNMGSLMVDKAAADAILKDMYANDKGNELPANMEAMSQLLDIVRKEPDILNMAPMDAIQELQSRGISNGKGTIQNSFVLQQMLDTVKDNFGKFMTDQAGAEQALQKMLTDADIQGVSSEYAFRVVMDALDHRPELLSMDRDSVEASLMETMPQGTDENLIRAMVATLEFAKNDKTNSAYSHAIRLKGMYANQKDMRKFSANAEQRRTNMRAYEERLFSSSGGIMQVFQGGFSMKRLGDVMAAQDVLQMALHDDTFDIVAAGMTQASERFAVDTEEGAKEGQAYVKRLVNFANSVEGMSNQGFMSALDKFKQASQQEEPNEAEMRRQSALMSAYMEINKDAVDRYMTQTEYDSEGQQIKDVEKAREQKLERLAYAYANGESVVDLMARSSVNSQVMAIDDSEQVASSARDLLSAFRSGQVDKNGDNIIENYEGWDTFYKDTKQAMGPGAENTHVATALELLNDIMQTSHQGVMPNATVGDIMQKAMDAAGGSNGGVMDFIKEIWAQFAPMMSKQTEVLDKLNNTLDKRGTDNNGVFYKQPEVSTQD